MPDTLTHSPQNVVRQLLVDLGLCTPLSFPAFTNEPPTPDDCVTVYGPQGVDHGRTAPDSERQSHHGIQVRIRSRLEEVGYAKARLIALALDAVYDRGVTVEEFGEVGGASYVIHSINRTGEVLSLGREVGVSKRNLFVINALTTLRQLT